MTKLYSFDACPWCDKAKKYLTAKGIEYELRDIEKDPEAYRELIELTGEGACPVIAKGTEYVRGFNQEAIHRLLGIK